MLRSWWFWLLTVAALVLGIWGCDRFRMIYWVGSTDLEIEFVVTDAATGQSVPGATIKVVSEGGLYRDRDEKEFTLVTDQDGVVRRICQESMCSGTQSYLRFTDTFFVHLPRWIYRVSGPELEPGEFVVLDVPENRRRVKRLGARMTKLVVAVAVTKRRGEPD